MILKNLGEKDIKLNWGPWIETLDAGEEKEFPQAKALAILKRHSECVNIINKSLDEDEVKDGKVDNEDTYEAKKPTKKKATKKTTKKA